MIPKLYPLATQDTPYNKAPGSWNGLGEWKVCLHTTETSGEPGYDNNRLAPHLTYNPQTRTWKQHYDLDRPSESLRTYDNYQVFQVEIVCYSAKHIADQRDTRLWVGDLPDTALQDLADFVKWLNVYVSIPAVWPEKQALSWGQANAPGFRMTETEFVNFGGVLAHQHVPNNTHWDTGAFPWTDFMALLEDDMQMPPERYDDVVKLIDAGWIIGDINYYFPVQGDWSADLPDWEWVNVILAATAGASELKDHGHPVPDTGGPQ